MKTSLAILFPILIVALLILTPQVAFSEDLILGGFVEGLWGGGLDRDNPTHRDYPVAETRLQLRLESYSQNGEVFGRIDFTQDGFDSTNIDVDLREAYVKLRLGIGVDFKVGRQIFTWGTGDLIFINDVFAKDYRSFFLGRQDQYLKAPQTGLRTEWYTPLGSFTLVAIPDFEPNILPTGDRLSFYNPMLGRIVGSEGYMPAHQPANKFKNTEVAFRYALPISGYTLAAYAYRGFYKDPLGYSPEEGLFYPRLNVYGASVRGQIVGGILWIEGGYFDSRQDQCGHNYFIPNSSSSAMIGFERQVATDLTANLQFQADVMSNYDAYTSSRDNLIHAGMLPPDSPKADEVRTLLTSRWPKQLRSQTVTLSAFGFYSPSDNDAYIRLSTNYKYSDEIGLTAGANIFEGEDIYTMFGQFDKNDNVYARIDYWF